MKKANTIIETKQYVLCPHCEQSQSQIDHLFNGDGRDVTWGPWYCDECGCAYKGVVKGTDVFVEKSDKRKDKCLVFLKNNNVLLVVEDMYFDGELDVENKRYFYEEHTCPTNYLGVEMVVDLNDGHTDPHGIFEFAGVIPYINLDGVEDVRFMLPMSVDKETL